EHRPPPAGISYFRVLVTINMQLSKWLALALVAALLNVVTPTILVSTAAATTATLTLGVANLAVAAVGGAAALIGIAGLLAAKGGSRKRRAIIVPDNGFSSDALQILFSSAIALDSDTNCGLRLVCELAATPADQLAADERLIMSLFGAQELVSIDSVNGAIAPFQLSVFLGRQSQDASACSNTYSKCQYNSNQIMDILRKNGNGQI
ncbi:unnamed protein product, partial [Meganyctiphanes norvegica]